MDVCGGPREAADGRSYRVPRQTPVGAPRFGGVRARGGDAARGVTPGSSQVSESPAVKAPLLSWPAGRRAAPDFVLRDQNGKKVSLAAYRTQTVIVTFVDPLCRNLCPLEAEVLNQAVREMPPSQRPVILAVSVDVYGDAGSHLLQDEQEWHLVPQ